MKHLFKFFFIAVLASFAVPAVYAQGTTPEGRRYIDVTGSAETSVRPDEVVLLFKIGEVKGKGGKDKVTLEEAQALFFATLAKYGLKEQDIILDNYRTYGVDWQTVSQNSRYEYKYKKLAVRIDSAINIVSLVNDMSQDWIDDISIIKLITKHEQKLRKEVKMQALQAAREKATYLLSAIGEELGKVIFIEEVNQYSSSSSLGSNAVNYNESYGDVTNTNRIRIRFEMRVRFEIK